MREGIGNQLYNHATGAVGCDDIQPDGWVVSTFPFQYSCSACCVCLSGIPSHCPSLSAPSAATNLKPLDALTDDQASVFTDGRTLVITQRQSSLLSKQGQGRFLRFMQFDLRTGDLLDCGRATTQGTSKCRCVSICSDVSLLLRHLPTATSTFHVAPQ